MAAPKSELRTEPGRPRSLPQWRLRETLASHTPATAVVLISLFISARSGPSSTHGDLMASRDTLNLSTQFLVLDEEHC